MKNTTWRATARRTLAVITTGALAGGLAIAGAGSAAADEPSLDVSGGSADWGVKQSFRNYISSPIAKGTVEVMDPAVQTANGGFSFEATEGTVSGTTADITFAGGVHFAGHLMQDVHALEMSFSNIRVHIDGDEGTLIADVVSREFLDMTTAGELEEHLDVELGELDLSENPLTVTGDAASLTDAPVTLTEAGVPAFGTFYEEGVELDPLSFSVDLAPATVAPTVTAQPQGVSVDEGEDAVFAAAATGTPEPTVQWQSRAGADAEWQDVDGAAGTSLTLAGVTPEQDGTQVRGVFTNGTEPDAVTEPATLTVVAAEEPEVPEVPEEPELPAEWEPALEVFAADGVTPLGEAEVTYGDTVVVKGSGFDPAANVGGRGVPIPNDLPQGTYVVFGKFLDQWQPSAGAPSSARVVGSQQWALAEGVLDQVPPQFQDAIRAQWVDIAEDGSFTAELEVAQPEAGFPEDGSFGVYTYGAGGVKNADQEQSALLNVVDEITEPEVPVEWEPALEVFAADGVTPLGEAEVTYGDTVVVKGSGFDPAGNVGGRGVPIPNDLPQGTYVVFGKFLDQWQPSAGAPSSARVVGSQQWALAEGVLDQVPPQFQDAIRAQWVDIAEDGSFTAELEVAQPEAGFPEDGSFGVYTYGAGGVKNADQEQSALLNVVDEITEPEVPVEWEPALEVFAADGVTPLGEAEVTYGDTVVVKGSGFDPAGNVGGRGVPIPNDLPQGTYVVFGKFLDQWQPSADAPSSARVVGSQKWALAEGVLDQVPPQFQGAIREQWVDIAQDGTFTAELTLSGLGNDWPQDGSFGVYTYGAGGVTNADQELSVPVTFVDQPQIEVFAADGVTPVADSQLVHGDTVVVKGSGFDPAGNVGGRGVPIPADLPQGTYVVFGKFLDQWQPSADAPSSARVVGSQKWALAEGVLDQVPPQFQGAIREQWVDIAQDGTFTAELEIARPGDDREGNPVNWPADGSFGVYTYAAGGVTNAAQEQSVHLDVVEERRPQLEVTPTEGLTVDTVVSVRGTGYAPNRAISIAFTPNTVKHEEFGWPVGWLQHEVVTTDALGSFTRETTVSGWVTGTGDDCSAVDCFLATFNSAQASDATEQDHRAERDQDVFVPVTFVAGDPEPAPGEAAVSATPNPVRQGEELTVAGSNLPVGAEVAALLEPASDSAAGHLDWGVKESFRSYVTGQIAHGQITLGDGATENADGSYRFPAAVASADPSSGSTVLGFTGSVSFEGHEIDGTSALEIHLANLRIQLTADSAVLVADATSRDFRDTTSTGELTEYPGVVLATLDADAFDVETGTVEATAAAAVLTATGEPAFGGFYQGEVALDPLSVDVRYGAAVAVPVALNALAETGTPLGTATVDEDGVFATTWQVPTEFPIGSYAVVLRDVDGAVLASDSLAVLTAVATPGDGDGGTPEEPEPEPEAPAQGTVVVEPDPVRQGATATFSGSGLTPGTAVGAVVDAAGAPGTLEWGVKESFRSYIGGNIAHGEITAIAPATETGASTYVFSEGAGSGDERDATAQFAGAVSFAGHKIGDTHALEVTITDPSVVITDGVGQLVADVTSREFIDTTSTGVLTESIDVVLADLDLGAGDVTVVDGRLVGTDVPATLTEAGIPAFADFYDVGEALDPVTFSVPVGDVTELDLTELDTAEAKVGEDGTVELSWAVPADFALGSHSVHLVTDGEAVADATFGVVAAATGGSGSDPDDDATPAPKAGGSGTALPTTGADVGALIALAAGVLLVGAATVAVRRRETA
ncbi:HtaA domain-containing protein [Georgenia sp. MJ170]|uniref:HtaA domain-containing protein n=1 Tax=Georgenia sunbinii TaxID=3117728 RepID=UPI002F2690AF